MTPVPINAEPLECYRIYVEYSDDACGEVDRTDVVGQSVFNVWRDCEQVPTSELGAIAWGDEIDIRPDTVYFGLTSKTPEASASRRST